MYNLSIIVILCVISGCATNETNIARLDDEYYRETITKSESNQQLKDYLSQNKIKLITIGCIHNVAGGAFSAVMIDGNAINFVTDTTDKFLKESRDGLFLSGLGKFYTNEAAKNNYVLSYCGDYTHANIGENGISGAMEYSYSLSYMSKEEYQDALKRPVFNCESLVTYGSDIFYKNTIRVDSNASNAKIKATPKDKSKPLPTITNVSIILKEMTDKAVTAILTDKNMLQALKDYKLAGSKALHPPKASSTEPVVPIQNVNLDNFKTKCKDLGFKEGSKDFGNCVLQLME